MLVGDMESDRSGKCDGVGVGVGRLKGKEEGSMPPEVLVEEDRYGGGKVVWMRFWCS